MKNELIKYVENKFSGSRIEIQEMGTKENGTLWIDIYSTINTFEIVIYPHENKVGISTINEDTVPFTGHDKVFNDLNSAINHLEYLTIEK